MKITFVIPFASLAGGNRVVALHARALARLGHEVTVVSWPAAEAPHPLSPGSLLARLRGRPPRAPKAASPLFDALGDRHVVLDSRRPVVARDLPDADAVIATWWLTAEWVADLPPEKGRKFYLLQDHEVFVDEADRVRATYRLPLRKIAVSGYIRDRVAEDSGETDIAVVLNAVDAAQFDAPPRRKGDPIRAGFLYTAKRRKRIDLAIAALAAARARRPEIRALAFGAVRPAESLPLPGWIDYMVLPAQEAIPRLYAACDLWLFTSSHEGFGLPILEAMACRTPVLATRAGAAANLVTDRNGRLLDADPELFAAEILRIADMPAEDWRQLSDAAYATARSRSWPDAAEELLRVLAEPAP